MIQDKYKELLAAKESTAKLEQEYNKLVLQVIKQSGIFALLRFELEAFYDYARLTLKTDILEKVFENLGIREPYRNIHLQIDISGMPIILNLRDDFVSIEGCDKALAIFAKDWNLQIDYTEMEEYVRKEINEIMKIQIRIDLFKSATENAN